VLRLRRSLFIALALLPLVALSSTPLPLDGQDAEDIARLELTPQRPKSITIYPTGDGDLSAGSSLAKGRLYWYLPYTLENKSAKSGDFFVTVRATSDKGRRYSDLALPKVEQRIEKLEKREFHSKSDLLTDKKKLNAYRTFAPGDKLDCLAIFNPIDPEADDIKIFVHGLVDDIRIDEMPGGGFRVTERVLELTYERPGDEFYTSLDAFEFKGSKWTKRVIETSSD
jgi:hypothetical protein